MSETRIDAGPADPMHNGRFDFATGEARGAPACVDLKTYPDKVEDGRLFLTLG